MNSTLTKTVRDRNLIAYLLANGFICEFIRRDSSNELDARFSVTSALERACMDYAGNRPVPVQSFIAACRVIGQQIQSNRQQMGV